MTSKYKQGKIYKLVCNGLIYIGSTIQKLSQRKGEHKMYYKNYLLTGKSRCSSTDLFKLEQEVDIFLIEEYPCKTKAELCLREKYWYELTECVNHQNPYRTIEEIKNYKKQEAKVYRLKHKEEIAIKSKNYKQKQKILLKSNLLL